MLSVPSLSTSSPSFSSLLSLVFLFFLFSCSFCKAGCGYVPVRQKTSSTMVVWGYPGVNLLNQKRLPTKQIHFFFLNTDEGTEFKS